MARRGQREIIEMAKTIFGHYVKEIRVEKDSVDHPVMTLFYNNNHKMIIMQNSSFERILAGKWPNQVYSISITTLSGKVVSQKQFLTAKMVKMAILKTKVLDILKGTKGVNLWA